MMSRKASRIKDERTACAALATRNEWKLHIAQRKDSFLLLRTRSAKRLILIVRRIKKLETQKDSYEVAAA